jgi:hypothetical protein
LFHNREIRFNPSISFFNHFPSRFMSTSCDNPPGKIPYYRLRPIHFGC